MSKKNWIYIGVAGGVVVLGLLTFLIISLTSQVNEMKMEKEVLELENEQLSLAGEYEQLNTELVNDENQTKYLTDAS